MLALSFGFARRAVVCKLLGIHSMLSQNLRMHLVWLTYKTARKTRKTTSRFIDAGSHKKKLKN
jgi:hypothetical protein